MAFDRFSSRSVSDGPVSGWRCFSKCAAHSSESESGRFDRTIGSSRLGGSKTWDVAVSYFAGVTSHRLNMKSRFKGKGDLQPL